MQFKPLNGYIVIKKSEVMSKTASGILIPGQAQNLPFEGVVITVYDPYENDRGVLIYPKLRPGERIIFNPNAVRDLSVGHEEYSVLLEKEVIGVLWETASAVE